MDITVIKSFFPEVFLSLSLLFQLVFNIRLINNLKYNYPIVDQEVFYQTLFILISMFFLYTNLKIEGYFSNFLFINDDSTRIIKMLVLITCFLTFNIVLQTFKLQKLNFFEYFVIFLISLLSLLLLISASDLISFYLVIEMQALCFYVLASFKRYSSFSAEAGLKYFISGAFISGFFLLGSSLLYFALGTLNFNALTILLSFPFSESNSTLEYITFIGIIFITSTLLFKISCAPFHFWSPDVYDGSPLSSTIIFSIIPKLSLITFFIKWLCCLNIYSSNISFMLLICGISSVFIGTFYALNQKRLKKLIIYSSIAQIGFIAIGLASNTLGGYSAIIFFLIIYLITSILVWGHFSLFYSFQQKINTFFNKTSSPLFISSLTNLFNKNKLWGFSFIIIFFSIGGIPPLTGFLAKILILFEVINSNNIIIASVLIILSSISMFYYIRMIKIMFFEPKGIDKSYEKFQIIFHNSSLDKIYLCVAFLLFLLMVSFFFPTGLLILCEYIILNLSGF